MLNADTYWAAYDTLARRSNPPVVPPKPAVRSIAEHLEGGCLLYRFPLTPGRGTDNGQAQRDFRNFPYP